MRRAILLLTVMIAALVLGSGIALAVNKVGTQGRDFLKGTDGADHLVGRGDDDRIFSLAAKDILIGGPGKDWVWGGSIRSSHRTVRVDYTSSGGNKNLLGGSATMQSLAAKAPTMYWARKVTTSFQTEDPIANLPQTSSPLEAATPW